MDAAALPMAIETACRCLDILGVTGRQTLLVYGAGTVIGLAAVQMAQRRGARVIAAAGDTFAGRLRAFGAEVTPYGDGMVERVRGIASGAPDLIFDAGPISAVLPGLVRIAGGAQAVCSRSAITVPLPSDSACATASRAACATMSSASS